MGRQCPQDCRSRHGTGRACRQHRRAWPSHNLIVRKDCKGKHAVITEGRRLAVLRLLADEGRIAKDHPVPCQLHEDNRDHSELRLVENTLREAYEYHLGTSLLGRSASEKVLCDIALMNASAGASSRGSHKTGQPNRTCGPLPCSCSGQIECARGSLKGDQGLSQAHP
jgi:hypothetical protein